MSSTHIDVATQKHDSMFHSFIKKCKSVKNYIFSKLRSDKYDLQEKRDVTIISCSQQDFASADKKLDVIPTSITINPKVLEAMNALLQNNRNNGKDLEVLEVIQTTFSKQLEICEQIVKSRHQNFTLEELQNSDKDNINKSRFSHVSNIQSDDLMRLPQLQDDATSSISFGDNEQIKNVDICCECQRPTESGAAVPRASND